VAEAAQARWQADAARRERDLVALAERRYTDVEPPEQLARRANRLIDKVRHQLPRTEALPEDLRGLVSRGPIAPEEIDDAFFERVLGLTRDFLASEFLELGLIASRAVGRVVTELGGGRRGLGTGFLVSPHLMLTNHHVLPSADEAQRSVLELDYQRGPAGGALPVQRFRLEPGRFFLNDRALDFALVAVAGSTEQGRLLAEYGWCPLVADEGKLVTGEPANVVQHPQGRMKQIVLRDNLVMSLLEPMAHYRADTEPGSSGSPVFNDQWEVVALHHSGVPKTDTAGNLLDVDGNVWRRGDDPSRLAWVANEGIRVSRLVSFLRQAQVPDAGRPLLEALLRAQPPEQPGAPRPIAGLPAGPGEVAPAPGGLGLGSGSVTVTVPLRITVTLGAASADGSAGTGVSAVELPGDQPDAGPLPALDVVESIRPDPDYAHRPGFDPDFLGFTTPLPRLSESIRPQAATVGAPGRHELKYHHYSVIFNKERRLAFLAAVNLDPGAPARHARDGGDRWFFDPRLPKALQAGEEFYAANPLDRGHLVARTDAAWGATPEAAKIASDDTFHFTNAAPQHEIFNRSGLATQRHLKLWGNLENHIAAQAKRDNRRLVVYNGPVFRADDRRHRGLPLPREFWKVVVFAKDDGGRSAVAFLLSQAELIQALPEEEFRVAEYRVFQVKLAEVERRTGLDFGDLGDLDPLERSGAEERFEAGTEVVPLSGEADIVL
jgi:endonuclease G